ncbi:TonB-dependent siderophore receptor [Bordetella genomosp. 8]|uniref:TonB-dependent siderophore receptor n=1 Tax=Bordetella genomosp. 8 TaxID=1416806 RepID=A0A1W6YFA0_9BORD|nr:TonB-dependent siderophore receptor [Bordetella genomosp. 8]ARP79718.1 TonB-dependent siderophore receptor [Bordetella genomosp. 8]
MLIAGRRRAHPDTPDRSTKADTRRAFQPRAIIRLLAAVGCGTALYGAVPDHAWAQSAPRSAPGSAAQPAGAAAGQPPQALATARQFDIPAGALAPALRSLASSANVLLTFTEDQAAGKRTAGISGRYTPRAALASLLAGTGLEAVQQDNGGYLLRPAPDTSTTLPEVKVTGSAVSDAATEGSGSYAANTATIGKIPVPIKEIPASVSVLTRERMDDQNVATIQQGLRYVTGVGSVDYGDGTGYYRARGNQMGIEFDGVSIMNGLQYQQQFDMAMYDRVEVLRGPAGVTDDSLGQPGGTVNLVRKRPQDEFHLSSETQISTFGGARQVFDVGGPLNEAGTLRGRAVIAGNNWQQSVDVTRNRNAMGYVALDYDFSPRTTLSFSGGYQVTKITGLDYGAGGVINDTRTALVGRVPGSYHDNYSPDWNRSYTALKEANANLTHRFDNGWTWDSTAFYRETRLSAKYAYSGPAATADGQARFGDQRQLTDVDWAGFDTHASGPVQAFGLTHTLMAGFNYAQMNQRAKSGFVPLAGPNPGGLFSLYDADDVPEVSVPFTYDAKSRLEQYSFYTQGRVKLADPVTLVLGAREAYLQERSKSVLSADPSWGTIADVKHRFLPSAGLVWDITPSTTAYANFSRFMTAQTATSFTGALLPPRTGEQYEIGLKNSFLDNRLNTTVALFRINDKDRAVTDPDHPTGSIPGGKARDQGVEFEVNGQPTPNWNVYAGYTYLNVKFANDDADLTDGTDPKHLFKLWTKYKFTDGPLQKVSVGGGMLAQTAITRGVTQGGYAIFNATVGYQVNQNVDVSIALNNIFDRDYYIRPPGYFYSVFGDRRNAMLTVRYHL